MTAVALVSVGNLVRDVFGVWSAVMPSVAGMAGAMVSFVLWSRWRRRHLGAGPIQPIAGRCAKHRDLFIPLPIDRVRTLAVEALREAGAEVAWIEPFRVGGTRGTGFWTWGEVLVVWLYPDGESTRVLVESHLLIWALIDWGQNLRNVSRIADRLTADGSPLVGAAGWNPRRAWTKV